MVPFTQWSKGKVILIKNITLNYISITDSKGITPSNASQYTPDYLNDDKSTLNKHNGLMFAGI